jgi:hypothetical protein
MQLYKKPLSHQMKSVCLYYRSWAAVAGRDRLKLDDWAGQLVEIQEAEAAVPGGACVGDHKCEATKAVARCGRRRNILQEIVPVYKQWFPYCTFRMN